MSDRGTEKMAKKQMRFKNISMGDFNRSVNSSYNPDYKYKLWSEYRKKINRLINDITAVKSGRPRDVIVFGAGECNDLELNYLCHKFDKIVLTDVDSQSIEEGIKRQCLEKDYFEKIEIKQIEYTGLGKVNFFEKMLELISGKAPKNEILNYIEEAYNKSEDIKTLEEYKNRFSVVLSTPVYTQLVYTQIKTMLDIMGYMGFHTQAALNEIETKVLDYIPGILERYNALMVSVAASDSVIGMWTDMLEMEAKGAVMETVKAALKLQESQPDALEEYIVERGGRGLAYYGREDLLNRIDVVKSYWLIWPFDEIRSYLVYGCFGTL